MQGLVSGVEGVGKGGNRGVAGVGWGWRFWELGILCVLVLFHSASRQLCFRFCFFLLSTVFVVQIGSHWDVG